MFPSFFTSAWSSAQGFVVFVAADTLPGAFVHVVQLVQAASGPDPRTVYASMDSFAPIAAGLRRCFQRRCTTFRTRSSGVGLQSCADEKDLSAMPGSPIAA
jgi:hypothetical protein